MAPDDAPGVVATSDCSSDEWLRHHTEYRVARCPGDECRPEDPEGDGRQGHRLDVADRVLEERDVAADREEERMRREEVDEQAADDEVGNAQPESAEQPAPARQSPAVGGQCGGHSQRRPRHERDQRRQHGELDGHRGASAELVENRPLAGQRRAEIAGHRLTEPAQVLLAERRVQPVLLGDDLSEFRGGERAEEDLLVAARDTVDRHEDDDRDAEQRDQRRSDPDQNPSHGCHHAATNRRIMVSAGGLFELCDEPELIDVALDRMDDRADQIGAVRHHARTGDERDDARVHVDRLARRSQAPRSAPGSRPATSGLDRSAR